MVALVLVCFALVALGCCNAQDHYSLDPEDYYPEPSIYLTPPHEPDIEDVTCQCSPMEGKLSVAENEAITLFGLFSNIFSTAYNFVDILKTLYDQVNPNSPLTKIQEQLDFLISIHAGRNDIQSTATNNHWIKK